jgi:hypothetical protein
MRILGVSLHKVLLLFLSFSKSPSLLKMEFGCKRYHVFCMSVFAVLQIRSEIQSCSGMLWAEQWRCTRSRVQAEATLSSAPERPKISVTSSFLAL